VRRCEGALLGDQLDTRWSSLTQDGIQPTRPKSRIAARFRHRRIPGSVYGPVQLVSRWIPCALGRRGRVRFHGLRGVRLPGCGSRRRGGHGHQHDRGQEHHNGSRGRQPQCLGSRAQARLRLPPPSCAASFKRPCMRPPHRVIACDRRERSSL
jgi:hypothetical protein